jgi:RHS repeat-associated protein
MSTVADNRSTGTSGQSEANARGAVALPSISPAKGGGAIGGIGEKFNVNTATGTSSIAVPLASSPGRSGFGPQFTLSYDSGAGNGAFGFGWTLSLPAITRKTDKGLPRYLDLDESDVFLLSGSEDLVPIVDALGKRVSFNRTVHNVAYSIRLYRPRVEGLFGRIERWTEVATGISHWRTITRDNVTSIFGAAENSRVFEPGHPERAFSYLLAFTFDDKGNASRYEYIADDNKQVDLTAAHESNRASDFRKVQRYLQTVSYGNEQPYFPDWSESGAAPLLPTAWRFQLVFDYGDHPGANPTPVRNPNWPVRPDAFSRYRTGFEVRTYRRCERVLLFHNFPLEPVVGADCLVRSTDFAYSDKVNPANPTNPVYTFLQSVTQTGYTKIAGGYDRRSTPPLEFEYSTPEISSAVVTLDDPDSRNNLPEGVDGVRFRLLDLDGEGLPGVLTEQNGGWGYKANLSPINLVPQPGGSPVARAKFAAMVRVAALPEPTNLAEQQFLDLTGNGRLDAASLDGPVAGFYERTTDDGWAPLKTFRSLPRINWSEPNLQFVDLTGDGVSDVLITEDDLFTFYPSRGAEGFGEGQRVRTPTTEERGPHIVVADGTHTISLADMTGDGLRDLVRVRNGEVCYWPNMGGRFGAKVTMDSAPRFASEDQFDPKRVRMADIDGSGTADLIYLGEDGIQIYFNRCGNSWSKPTNLNVFPRSDQMSSLQAADLLGTGTACLVWSSQLPGETRAPLRYIDLMGSRKPHLMVSVRNNYGSETRVAYAPSTRFYLEDKRNGRPWVTRLPFPVQVVERVETYDWIGRSRFVVRYNYHHGFFDGVEREFRGFGMVDERDTELHRGDTLFPEAIPKNEDPASFHPPALTKYWFHTGAFFEAGLVSKQYEHEYWTEPGLAGAGLRVPDSVMADADLTAEERREACRALKGAVLRVEIYSEDGSTRAGIPFGVTENNYTVTRVQGFGPNQHAVFRINPRESVSLHYERQADDPRIGHEFTLETDEFGNVQRTASAAYPRRAGYTEPEPTLSAAFRDMLKHDQTRLRASAAEHRYTDPPVNRLEAGSPFDVYRGRLACETISAELTGFAPAGALFSFSEIDGHHKTLWTGLHDVAYEDVSTPDVEGVGAPTAYARRIVARSQTLFRADDLSGLLPLGTAGTLGLSGESYELALSAGMIPRVFGGRVTDPMLTEGGYVRLPGQGDWWIPSGRTYLSPGDGDAPAVELAEARAHFFKSRRSVDPFGGIARITYDAYDLMPVSSIDPAGNVSTSINNYRVLQPRRITDPNGDFTEVAFDCLGQLTGSAVSGSAGEGDSLAGFQADLTDAQMAGARANPLAAPAALLGNATTRYVYDRMAYFRTRANPTPDPPMTYTLARETHVSALNGGATRFRHEIVYADGFGREAQRKLQAEPVSGVPRWVTTGWTVFNNKGLPVQKFEPFFTPVVAFEFNRAAGVSSVQFYDPAGRGIAKLHPDSTFEKVLFDAWREEQWDLNDTVKIDDPRTDGDVGAYFTRWLGSAPGAWQSWRQRRIGGLLGATPEERAANQDAAQKAEQHAATPAVTHLDSVGRPCLHVKDNGGGKRFAARTALDTENKPLAVIDAAGRHAVEHCVREPMGAGFRYVAAYSLAGAMLYGNGMDSGEQRMLNDIGGNPIRHWDARGFVVRTLYDALRRPTHVYVGRAAFGEILAERMIYGEKHPDADRRLKRKLFRHYDSAGVSIHERYDFKGNLVESTRQLGATYRTTADWTPLGGIADASAAAIAAMDAAAKPLLIAADRFASSSRFDALNRVTQTVTPHQAGGRPSVIQPSYNETSRLESLDVWIREAAAPAALLNPATAGLHAVTNIDYDARGQRIRIELSNGAVTEYGYDSDTFRVVTITTARPDADPHKRTVQALSYTYDPVGNVTRLRDDADIHNVVYFRNQRLDPTADYRYDAVYRLTSATGREHTGQRPPQQVTADDAFRMAIDAPGDGMAMARYTENYVYDPAGNLLQMIHQLASGNWARLYAYNETSRITPSELSNRLSATKAPGDIPMGPFSDTYTYDEQGNMTRMPHLPLMTWDEHDRLQSTARQVVAAGTPETTYYSYDAAGTRLRKTTDLQAGAGVEPRRKAERIYLGIIELHREYGADGVTITLERETLLLTDDKQRIAMVETRMQGMDRGLPQLVRYQFSNHLGSAALELDGVADVITYEEYFPYGGTSYQAVRSQTETPKRYRFTGKERDEENDLYYHGARYYAPWLGRWTSCDPVGNGNNVYEYCDSNPIMLHDPDGADGSIWDTFKPGGSVFEAADKVFNPTNPVAKGIMNNLDKRGEALMKAPGAIADLYHKEGAVGVVTTMGKGAAHLVTDTGDALGDIAWEATHYQGPKSAEKIANRATDVVLNTADVVSIAAGGAGAAKGGLAIAKAAPSIVKNVGTTVKVGMEVLSEGAQVMKPAVAVAGGGAEVLNGGTKALAVAATGVKAGGSSLAITAGTWSMASATARAAGGKPSGGSGAGSGSGPAKPAAKPSGKGPGKPSGKGGGKAKPAAAASKVTAGTMTETGFKAMMKTNIGVYVYRMVDEAGNVVKWGTTENPFKRVYGYGGKGYTQMEVMGGPYPRPQALSVETTEAATLGELGENIRANTLGEMKGGADWYGIIENPRLTSNKPMISLGVKP